MKQVRFSLFFIFNFALLFSQNGEEPVIWSQEVRKLSDTEYELTLKGEILEGWHIYSQHTPEGGSMPSQLTFDKAGDKYRLLGKTLESRTVSKYSEVFEVNEVFFKDKVVFTQKVKLLTPGLKQVNVNLWYQICKEVCIPADMDFSFALDGNGVVMEN